MVVLNGIANRLEGTRTRARAHTHRTLRNFLQGKLDRVINGSFLLNKRGIPNFYCIYINIARLTIIYRGLKKSLFEIF